MPRRLSLAPALLFLLVGCAASTPEPATPESAPSGAEPTTAPSRESASPATSATASAAPNPCDHLDPHVFDIDDVGARTDLSDAQKDDLRHKQSERRRVLAECFVRAMHEHEAGSVPSGAQSH